MRLLRAVVGGVAVAALTAGCGGGDRGTGGAGDAGAAADGGSLAEVFPIDDRVDVRLGEDVDFARVSDAAQPVKLGDAVRTDGSGFAEVRYFDGSVTRLDVDTEFTVVELSDAAGASLVRSDMGLGRTWHRVEQLSGEDRYEVETAVATAVVRGTAFLIECPSEDECSFTVIAGTVEVVADDETVTVEAGESATVTDDDVGDVTPVSGVPMEDDDWLARNTDLDTDAGFDELAGREPAGASDGDDGIDLEHVDACAMFDRGDVEAILARPLESVDDGTPLAGGAACMWDAGYVAVPAGGSYRVWMQVQIRPGSSLPRISMGEGCAERGLDGLGREARVVECPAADGHPGDFMVLVLLPDDVVVTVWVDPDRPISLDEVTQVVEDVIGQLS